MTTLAASPAADRFVTALIWGWPWLLGAVVIALVALYAAGLVELAKTTDVVYTRTPDAIEQVERADKAKARRVEAERAMRGEVA